MSGERLSGTPIDDERLLALALGIDDDALGATVLERPDLAQRLARTHDDIDAVVRRLHAAVPAAPDDYAEPSAERWPVLAEYFGTPAAPVTSRRGWRGRRGRLTAALAVMALLALVVGVGVGIVDLGGGASNGSAPMSVADEGAAPAAATAADKGGAEGFVSGPIVLPEAAHFRAVVVARAGAIVDDVQRFAVLRILKGRVGDSVALLLHEGAVAFPAGSLEVLYLGPLDGYGMAADPTSDDPTDDRGPEATPAQGSDVPTPLAAPRPDDLPAPAAGYSLGTEAAYVQAIPAGVDYSLLSTR